MVAGCCSVVERVGMNKKTQNIAFIHVTYDDCFWDVLKLRENLETHFAVHMILNF